MPVTEPRVAGIMDNLIENLMRVKAAMDRADAGSAVRRARPRTGVAPPAPASEASVPVPDTATSDRLVAAEQLVRSLMSLPELAEATLDASATKLLAAVAPDVAERRAADAADAAAARETAAAGPAVAADAPPPPPAAEAADVVGASLAASASALAASASGHHTSIPSAYDDDDLHSRFVPSPCRGSLLPDEEEEDSGHPAADDADDIHVDFEELSLHGFEELEEADGRARQAEAAARREAQQAWEARARAAAAKGGPVPPLPSILAAVIARPDPSVEDARRASVEARRWMSGAAQGDNSAPLPSPWAVPWPVPEPESGSEEDDDAPRPCFASFALRVVYESGRTGFADDKDFRPRVGSTIAGRFRVTRKLGTAAFSQAVAATDLCSGREVCLKIVKNNKEYLDQSLDEIKLLEYVNRRASDVLRRAAGVGDGPRPSAGEAEAAGRVLRLVDFFYFQEHLFIVTELLKDNLYDFQKFLFRRGLPAFFTPPRVRSVARQILAALSFVHGVGILHCDLKPENLLLSSYSRCRVKVIDFGSSCFVTDHLTSYIQSRSYRAPEVILGCEYGPKIDVWSLGCILFELLTGRVLFVNDSVPTILARMQSVLGPIPRHMVESGKESASFFTQGGSIFESPEREDEPYLVITSRAVPFEEVMGVEDPELADFLKRLLTIDPADRPTAEEALQHPFMTNDREFGPYELPVAGQNGRWRG